MIFGAVYYLWRYSSQTTASGVDEKPSLKQEIEDLIKVEETPSLEQEIEDLINKDAFFGVESMIQKLQDPDKIAKWNEIFYERQCLYHFNKKAFPYAYADALKIQELVKKNDLLIQIFTACLSQKLAWQISNQIKLSDPDSLKEGCIDAADRAEDFTLAFSLVPRLSDVSKQKKWLGILVPRIAGNGLKIQNLLGYAVVPGPKQDELLEKIIPILIEENHRADARVLTSGITDEGKRAFWQAKIKTSCKTQEPKTLPEH